MSKNVTILVVGLILFMLLHSILGILAGPVGFAIGFLIGLFRPQIILGLFKEDVRNDRDGF
jgi:uncharacterized protein YebE (UPF0316 family)